jgi:GNAT superfamily N-acetyltransferase
MRIFSEGRASARPRFIARDEIFWDVRKHVPPVATSQSRQKISARKMSEQFCVRLANPADADIIGWHRARMFQDMGDVPPHLFDKFCAMSRDRLREQLASGEYIGWLASAKDAANKIIGGAGVQLRHVMPHPLTSANGDAGIAEGRHAIILNVFTEPEWRRRGVAALLMQHIIDWSRKERLDRLVLHASDDGRTLYKRLGFVLTNEMKFVGKIPGSARC